MYPWSNMMVFFIFLVAAFLKFAYLAPVNPDCNSLDIEELLMAKASLSVIRDRLDLCPRENAKFFQLSATHALRTNRFDVLELLLHDFKLSGHSYFGIPSRQHKISIACLAAEFNNVEALKILHENGTDFNTGDPYADLPLFHAIRKNSFDAVKYLIDIGVDLGVCSPISFHGPIGTALPHENLDEQGWILRFRICQFLIDSGADINFVGTFQSTPMSHAMYLGPGVVMWLIERGGNVNLINNDAKSAPLAWAIRNGHSEDLIRALIDNGADVGIVDDASLRAFGGLINLAILNSSFTVVRWLVEAGAPRNIENGKKMTPVMQAADMNSIVYLKYFLEELNGDVFVTNSEGHTLLDFAHGSKACVTYLKKMMNRQRRIN